MSAALALNQPPGHPFPGEGEPAVDPPVEPTEPCEPDETPEDDEGTEVDADP